jgi:hypothetical protein
VVAFGGGKSRLAAIAAVVAVVGVGTFLIIQSASPANEELRQVTVKDLEAEEQVITPGGPSVSVVVENSGQWPIVNLTVTLSIDPNDVMSFRNVSVTQPLHPGEFASASGVLIGHSVDCGRIYGLNFTGDAYSRISPSTGIPFDLAVNAKLYCPPS